MQRTLASTVRILGVLVFVGSAAPVSTSSVDAAPSDPPVTGTVYRDYDADAVRDDREPGVAGIVATAYDAVGGTATDTTAADGTYSIDVTGLVDSTFRIEFEIPASLSYLEAGVAGGTSVQFADAGDVVDYTVNNPGDYCGAVATLATTCFSYGDHDDATTAGNATVVEFAEDADGDVSGTYDERSDHLDVGSVYGIAYGRPSPTAPTGTLYVGAFAKRHTGFGPSGPGAIYAIDRDSGAISTLTTLAAGTDPHPDLPDVSATTPAGRSTDAATFDAVGKIGLGDLEMSEDGSVLYTINLADRSLYRIDPASGATIGSSAVPAPGCPGGDADNWRPFALGVQDGVVYAGGVCSGQSDDLSASLETHVYAWTESTATWSATPVYTLDAMDYTKGSAESYFHSVPPGDFTGLYLADAWRPWTDDFDDYVLDPTAAIPTNVGVCLDGDTVEWGLGAGEFLCAHPQPMLADIAFDNGDLILSYMDRYGHQGGTLNAPTELPDPATDFFVAIAGELIRACGSPATGWTTESNAACTSASDWPTSNGGAATAGAGNLRGPDGGEFYVGTEYSNHEDTTIGGVVQIPGREHVFNVVSDPFAVTTAGVILLDNETGDQTSGRSVQITDLGMFSKANGLGDLEAMCDSAPIEIGNYVWFDENRDGVQGPDEDPIEGVTVNLYADANGDGEPDGTAVATATTDADGNYLFLADDAPTYTASGATPGDDTDHLGEVIGGLTVRERYLIRFDEPTDYDTGGPLAGLIPTIDNVGNSVAATIGDGSHRDDPTDRRDSDAVEGSSGFGEIAVVLGSAGQNDHTLDAGFFVPTLDLALRKQLDDGTNHAEVSVGDEVAFDITIFNQGTVAATDIEVIDYVPDGLVLTDDDWTLDAEGNARIALTGVVLLPGETTVVEITFTVAAGATSIVNLAEITAQRPIDGDGNTITQPNGDPIPDIDSQPDATQDDPLEDDRLDDDGTDDEDDHDLASLTVNAAPAVATTTTTTAPVATTAPTTATTVPTTVTPLIPASGPTTSTWVAFGLGVVFMGLGTAAVRSSRRPRPATAD